MAHPRTETGQVELTSLDLLNLKALVLARLDVLKGDKHEHPDLAHIFNEQIEVYLGTLKRIEDAILDSWVGPVR